MKKMIIIFISILFLTSFFIVNTTKAETKSYGFETSIIGTQVKLSDCDYLFNTVENIDGDFDISNTHAYSGTQSFRCRDATGFFYFTQNIGSFDAYAYYDFANTDPYLVFYDSSTLTGTPDKANKDAIIILQWYGDCVPFGSWGYKNSGGTWTTINTHIGVDEWSNFGFTINDVDNVTYYFNGTTAYGTPANITQLQNGATIDSIYLWCDHTTSDTYIYIDDLTVTTSSYGPTITKTKLLQDGTSCPIVFNSPITGTEYYIPMWGCFWCASEGLKDTNYYLNDPSKYSDSRYIEIQGTKTISGSIHYVDLYVSNAQRLLISDNMTDYHLYVNGEYWLDEPQFKNAGYGYYYLEWYNSIGTTLDNDTPIFEFSNDKIYYDYTIGTIQYGDIYWILEFPSSTCNFNALKHNDTDMWGDNAFNGAPITNLFKYTSSYSMPYHPVTPFFQFFYNQTFFNQGNTPIPPDELAKNKNTYGDTFIEFNDYDEKCLYGVGSTPQIRYFLDNQSFYYDKTYQYDIIQSTGKKIIGSGQISFNTPNISAKDVTLNGITFPMAGKYYILLYNVTQNFEHNLIVLNSLSLSVCEKPIDSNNNNENNFFGFIIPYWAKLIIGFVITLIMTILPLLISFMLSKGKIDIDIPALVYVAFFFLGLVISILLGFLDIIIIFIILIALLIVAMLMWLRGQNSG